MSSDGNSGEKGPVESDESQSNEGGDSGRSTSQFPVVALGASAGGLEALKSFFSEVKPDSGFAYIIVVHMAPAQPSMLAELVQSACEIDVSTPEHGEPLKPNHAYVIPPDKEIAVFKGEIQLMDIVDRTAFHPIDTLFKSLAIDQGPNSAAVVLSGTGTDGCSGLKEIKAAHGLVLAQTEDSASFDGMPRNAAATGLVDMILPPDRMPEVLWRFFAGNGIANGSVEQLDLDTDDTKWLNSVFAILRTQTGHDFSNYKTSTLIRRINRRMNLNQCNDTQDYIRFLRENPAEVEALFQECLIGVTSFFRDPESYEVLKKEFFPRLIEELGDDGVLRGWVPGCSSGEEVYSLAIILRELVEKQNHRISIQLFGTDVDSRAISKAREGLYPNTISGDIDSVRLNRYFAKEGESYRVRKEIRENIVFSVQDILRDPPFSRLSFVCCRNVLIYLNPAAQKRLLPLFHYTLVPGGVLVLGSSETIGGFTNLFGVGNQKWKVFNRLEVPSSTRQLVDFPSGPTTTEAAPGSRPTAVQFRDLDIASAANRAILDQFAPTAILVDSEGEILHVQGRTGHYLETPSGSPTQNIVDLAREGLRIELAAALRSAKTSDSHVTREGITVKTNGDSVSIDLHVSPQRQPKELTGRFLVVFEQVKPPSQSDSPKEAGETVPSGRITDLERELRITRESHQTTVEELESSNEELKSTNEELQSANEELQSTNEELESSKEELQSLNEELQTVNAELNSKVEELFAAHDDMRNLLNSTSVATVFIDKDLRVRRFTAESTRIINLIETDVGRPLEHVVTNLVDRSIMNDLKEVIDSLVAHESEVQTTHGDWYNMRIMPYRTTDNRIDGAVLTFSFIGEQKREQSDMRLAFNAKEKTGVLVRTVFDMNKSPLAVVDNDQGTVLVNASFCELFGTETEFKPETSIMEFTDQVSHGEAWKDRLEAAIRSKEDFTLSDIRLETASGGVSFAINGRVVPVEEGAAQLTLLEFVTL